MLSGNLQLVSERMEDHGNKVQEVGALALPPRSICVACYGNEMEWFEFKRKGKLSAFTSIVVTPPAMAKEGFDRNNPYIVGVVDLDEGVKAVARIAGVYAKKLGLLRIGTPFKADFLVKEEGGVKQTTLVFRP